MKITIFISAFLLISLFCFSVSTTDSLLRDREYCDSFWNNATDDWISNVSFNTINNSTGQEGDAQSYGDYTDMITDVELGASYQFYMSWVSDGFVQYGKVWFDWNQDEILDDVLEGYEIGFGADTGFFIDITIPWDALSGQTRMRVSECYGQYPDSCNDAGIEWGETEDYTINIFGDVVEPGILAGNVFLNGGDGNVEEVLLAINGLEVFPNIDGDYSVSLMPGNYNMNVSLENYYSIFLEDIIITTEITTILDITLELIIPHELPFFETFNAGMPADWQINDFNSDDFCWEVITDYNGQTMNGSLFAFVNSDEAGDAGTLLQEEMISPLINCQEASVLLLSFDSFYRQRGNQIGQIMVWDGESWNIVQTYNQTHGGWDNNYNEILDITAYINSELQVKFLFDDAAEWNWFWAVDNVQVYEPETGSIEGYVYVYDSNEAISGAVITTGNYEAVSNETGFFSFPFVPIGNYELNCSAEYFLAEVTEEFIVETGETSYINIYLKWAEIETNPLAFNISIPEYQTLDETITIHNNGVGDLEWRAYLQHEDYTTTADRSLAYGVSYFSEPSQNKFISFDSSDPANYTIINSNADYNCRAGCFLNDDSDFLYAINQQTDQLIKIDILTGEAEDLGNCGSPLAEGDWSGLACDRTSNQLYAICTDLSSTILYKIDNENGDIFLMGDIGISAGNLLVIDETGNGYVVCLESDALYGLTLENAQSNLIGEMGFDVNFAQDAAWDAATDEIYISVINETSQLLILDRFTAESEFVGILPGQLTALGFNSKLNNWLKIESNSGIIAAGNNMEINLTFDSEFLDNGDLVQGNLVFENNSNFQRGDDYLVALFMQVEAPPGVNNSSVESVRTRIICNYPNPFNPQTTIDFYLSEPGQIELGIYNIKGALVKVLHNKEMPAGKHSIIWLGDNEQGKSCASGIYFSRLKKGKSVSSRKLLLLK